MSNSEEPVLNMWLRELREMDIENERIDFARIGSLQRSGLIKQ